MERYNFFNILGDILSDDIEKKKRAFDTMMEMKLKNIKDEKTNNMFKKMNKFVIKKNKELMNKK